MFEQYRCQTDLFFVFYFIPYLKKKFVNSFSGQEGREKVLQTKISIM